MTALPDVLGVVRVALIGTFGEDVDVVNRFYMDCGEITGGPSDLDAFCAAVAAAWNTNLVTFFDATYTLTEVVAEDLTSAVSPVGSALVSHTGTRGGSALSGSACALLRFKIGRRYRGGHPRMYLSALTDADQTDMQTWSPTALANLVAAFEDFIADVISALETAYTSTGATHVNVSYYDGFENITYPSGRTYARPKLRTSPVTDNVISYSANPKIASQRRRNLTP
jgi:hypothetical protein